jgi:hypothetical protein
VQGAADRLAAQQLLGEQAALLELVWERHLYGGATLPDSVDDGAHDATSGSLFASKEHAEFLFEEWVGGSGVPGGGVKSVAGGLVHCRVQCLLETGIGRGSAEAEDA